MSKQIELHVKTVLWTPAGYDELDRTWKPQDICPTQIFNIPLDASGKSFVRIKLTEVDSAAPAASKETV